MHTIQILGFNYTLGSGPATALSVAEIEDQIDFGFTVMFDGDIIEYADGITGEVRIMGKWVQYSDLLSK